MNERIIFGCSHYNGIKITESNYYEILKKIYEELPDESYKKKLLKEYIKNDNENKT